MAATAAARLSHDEIREKLIELDELTELLRDNHALPREPGEGTETRWAVQGIERRLERYERLAKVSGLLAVGLAYGFALAQVWGKRRRE